MGGFMQHHDNGPPTVLKAEDVPDVTKRRMLEVEIRDKSKADGLSKTIALVQTTWFILQCISRAIEGISVTELEVATCAFAVLNFATYILWWSKPLNVCCPVLVYRDRKRLADEGQEREETGEEAPLEGKECGGGVFIRGLVDIPKEVYRGINGSVAKCRSRWELPFNFILPILGGTSFESNQRVGTFGPMAKLNSDEFNLWLTSVAVGVVFGGIHCAAWQFQFPSYIERLLWKISAISVTGGPILIGLFFTLITNTTSSWTKTLGFVGFAFVLILYIFVRLTLIVLSFMTLRSLPPGAFHTADWTHFIPHFA
jgi:hypothetical protein